MNVERSPVVNDVVLLRRDCNDTHLRVLAEQLVTNVWPCAGVVERDDHEIWQGSLYALRNLRLLTDFADNFDVGLIRERCEYELSHEPGTICHEHPDNLFHCALLEGLESVHQVDVAGKCLFIGWVYEELKDSYYMRSSRLASVSQ